MGFEEGWAKVQLMRYYRWKKELQQQQQKVSCDKQSCKCVVRNVHRRNIKLYSGNPT